MQKFERAEFEVKEYVESENYGKFILSPLERGFGTTIGNALRRVLLSSLPGAAVFSIKVDGVYHEFTSIPGVREDVSMIILQLKQLIMKIEDDEVYTLQISANGPCTVTAGDIICPAQVEILNKDLEIAHLENGVWFARCCPNANVVPLVMNHFAARFNIQPFIIYDENHHLAGVHDGNGWHLVADDVVNIPSRTAEDAHIEALWKRFYDSLAIEARYNPELRRHFIPARLARSLPEMEERSRTALKAVSDGESFGRRI